MLEASYPGEKPINARVGDVVMVRGNMRGPVIEIKGTFVRVLGIGTSLETGDTFVLPNRHIEELPASDWYYLEKQTLNLSGRPAGPQSTASDSGSVVPRGQ